MSYRFVRVAKCYPEYLEDFYRRSPASAEKSYDEQLSEILSDAFGWADFYSRNLRRLGVDAFEIIAGNPRLDCSWRAARGTHGGPDDIIIEQISHITPDVVLLQDAFLYSKKWIERLREKVPSIRLVLGWCSVPFTQSQLEGFTGLDAIMTCARDFLPSFERAGIQVHHLNHAFEPSLLVRIGARSAAWISNDLVFIGSLMPGNGMHNLRIKILENLVSDPSLSTRLYAHLWENSRSKTLFQQAAYVAYYAAKTLRLPTLESRIPAFRKVAAWESLPRRPKVSRELRAAIQKPVFGLEMFRVLRTSAVSFNNHIDSASHFAGNVRLFEATGAGSCLVTDWKENMSELFESDKEVITYRSVEECAEKVKWLLAHPKEREEIALAGQARCLKDHTYARRADEMNQIILKMLGCG